MVWYAITHNIPSKNAQHKVFNTVNVDLTHALQIKVVYVFRIGKNSSPMPFEWAKDISSRSENKNPNRIPTGDALKSNSLVKRR